MSEREAGDRLISLMNGYTLPLANGGTLPLRARWTTDFPRISQWSVRYPGVIRDAEHARALIESPTRGIGALNGLTDEAREEIRFIASHEVGEAGADQVIRFEVGERAAAELQIVIGERGGQISLGATETRVQHNRRDVRPDSDITFHRQF